MHSLHSLHSLHCCIAALLHCWAAAWLNTLSGSPSACSTRAQRMHFDQLRANGDGLPKISHPTPPVQAEPVKARAALWPNPPRSSVQTGLVSEQTGVSGILPIKQTGCGRFNHQRSASQARRIRAQASCRSAMLAAYEMRKYGASPSTLPGTTAT